MDEMKIKYFSPTNAVINNNDNSWYGDKFVFWMWFYTKCPKNLNYIDYIELSWYRGGIKVSNCNLIPLTFAAALLSLPLSPFCTSSFSGIVIKAGVNHKL